MHIDVFTPRDATHCPPGTFFYSCDANKFRGCCSQDPCALLVCPDDMSTMRDPGKDYESSEMPLETSTDRQKRATRTMTDSGTTRTIPNNSYVIVTKHTTITTDKMPLPTPSVTETEAPSSSTLESSTVVESSSFAPSEPTALPPAETSAAASTGSASPLSTGAIAGIATGGFVAIALLVILLVSLKRRRQRRKSDAVSTASRWGEEKTLPQSMSTHTTGTQGSSDPFAPFGGRADKPDDPYQAPNNTFEMDASCAPIELPAISVAPPQRQPQLSPFRQVSSHQYPVREAGPADPRANLNASVAERQQQAYVNHWNQYRNLDQGEG